MAGRRKEIAPELVANGCRLYENTLTPVRDIARVMGLSRDTLEPQHATAASESRQALPSVETSVTLPVPAELPANLAVRLQRAIDGHFDAIDCALKVLTPVQLSRGRAQRARPRSFRGRCRSS